MLFLSLGMFRKRIIFPCLWVFFFSFFAESCEEIKKKLELLNLSPHIKKNSDLIIALIGVYDKKLVDALREAHPFMFERGGKRKFIDIKTLDWVEAAIINEKKSGVRYKLFPFRYAKLNSEFEVFVAELVGEYDIPFLKSRPVFVDKAQRDAFKLVLNDKEYILKLFITERGNLTYQQQVKLTDSFIHFYQFDSNLDIGLSHIKNGDFISVIAHGESKDEIFTDSLTLKYNELSDLLLSLNPPEKSNIILDFCWSACPKDMSDMKKYTKSEIIEHFKNQTLHELLAKSKSDNFMTHFATDFFTKNAAFNGIVRGFLGEVGIGIENNVTSRAYNNDGEVIGTEEINGAHFLKIEAKDKCFTLLKDEGGVTLNRNDIQTML